MPFAAMVGGEGSVKNQQALSSGLDLKLSDLVLIKGQLEVKIWGSSFIPIMK